MGKFNLGDIVRMKMLGDVHYYMIRDITDLTQEGDSELDIDYEIVLVFPVTSNNPAVETMIHEELEKVADFKSDDYYTIMDYVRNQRVKIGFSEIPSSIEHIVSLEDEDEEVKQVKKPVKKKKKFGIGEIKAIMNDTTLDEQTEIFVERMNIHLDLMNEAIHNKDEEKIGFHKSQLEKIRQTLMELEYFPFKHNRR